MIMDYRHNTYVEKKIKLESYKLEFKKFQV